MPEAISPASQVPPNSLDAEMAVLGSMLIESEAVEKSLDIVDERDFYHEKHRKIVAVFKRLHSQGVRIDIVTASDELGRFKTLDEIGGPEYLQELIHRAVTAAHVEDYARIVKKKALLRELIMVSMENIASSYGEAKDPDRIIEEAQVRIHKISERQYLHGIVEIKDVLEKTVSRIEMAHKQKRAVTGIPTGIRGLDDATSGFQKGNLILIAARPGQGKTSLALNITLHNILADKPVPILFFSLEMSQDALGLRLVSSLARVDLHALNRGYFPHSHWPNITNAAARLHDAPLSLVDTPSSTFNVLNVRSISRQLTAKLRRKNQELGLVVVDYIQLLRGAGRAESRQQEVSEISRELKSLSLELQIPVLGLSQLRRMEQGRDGDRPKLSDLRESGALEQDADLVILIYREGADKPNDPMAQGKTELIIAKNRQGPLRTVPVSFKDNFTLFENLSQETEPAGIEEAQTSF